MSNEIDFLYAVAQRNLGITLANALGLLEDAKRYLVPVVTFDWKNSSVEARAAEAKGIASVMSFLPDRKIQAIKEIRTISGLGLKEAKDIIDTIQPPQTSYRSCCDTFSNQSHRSYCYSY